MSREFRNHFDFKIKFTITVRSCETACEYVKTIFEILDHCLISDKNIHTMNTHINISHREHVQWNSEYRTKISISNNKNIFCKNIDFE